MVEPFTREAIHLARVVALGAVLGLVGGVVYKAAGGDTTYHVAIAYGMWVAAALCLLAMPLAGSRRLYAQTSLPLVESWVFVVAAVVLCAVGALADVL